MYPSSYNNGNYPAEGVPAGTMNNFPQPSAPPAVRHGKPTQWSTGLCHCCDDPANALITCFCPCVTFGQTAEIINQGSLSCCTSGAIYALLLLTGFPCLYSCFYRSRLRGQFDLEETPAPDCLVHVCCQVCSLCQEHRELKNRGFDMSIGYQANMDRQRRGVTVAPTIGGMTR